MGLLLNKMKEMNQRHTKYHPDQLKFYPHPVAERSSYFERKRIKDENAYLLRRISENANNNGPYSFNKSEKS